MLACAEIHLVNMVRNQIVNVVQHAQEITRRSVVLGGEMPSIVQDIWVRVCISYNQFKYFNYSATQHVFCNNGNQ